jgi:hypothetical protein
LSLSFHPSVQSRNLLTFPHRQRHINDDNLPEVVIEPTHQHPPAQTSPQTSPPPPVSTVSPAPTSVMNWDGTQSPPILQHPALAQQQYAGQEGMSIPMQQQPHMQRSGPTVTPLHLLADQADSVDCPFCQHQTETKVKKSASGMTQCVPLQSCKEACLTVTAFTPPHSFSEPFLASCALTSAIAHQTSAITARTAVAKSQCANTEAR